MQSPGGCLREPCPQEAAKQSRNRAWMAGWAWGLSEITGGLGSGPRRAPAPCPIRHPRSVCPVRTPGDEALSWSSHKARVRGSGIWGGGHGRVLSTSSPLCSQMPAPTVGGVSPACTAATVSR